VGVTQSNNSSERRAMKSTGSEFSLKINFINSLHCVSGLLMLNIWCFLSK